MIKGNKLSCEEEYFKSIVFVFIISFAEIDIFCLTAQIDNKKLFYYCFFCIHRDTRGYDNDYDDDLDKGLSIASQLFKRHYMAVYLFLFFLHKADALSGLGLWVLRLQFRNGSADQYTTKHGYAKFGEGIRKIASTTPFVCGHNL